MVKRIWSLVIKDFTHLIRDWWLPAFMLFGGLLELLVIGWATSRPITNLPMMILDQDQSTASRELISALENTTTFSISHYALSYSEIDNAMDRGSINAAIIIPNKYGSEMEAQNGKPTIAAILNGAESTAATAALRSIEGLIADLGIGITIERFGLPEEALAGFIPSLRVWFNEALNEALYTTPAELGLMLEFTILVFAGLSFSREREMGTLENLLVMPFSSLEIIAGKSIPVIIIGFIDFILLGGIVRFAFDVPIRGSVSLLLLIALIYILVELGKGLVISVSSRTQHQAFLIILLVGMVDFLFTGYAVPVESMPSLLQILSNLIPAHHWLVILRGILLKGVGLEILWPNVLALVILGIVIGSISIIFVRRSLG
jgi:ABC-2 type transport system permease protein